MGERKPRISTRRGGDGTTLLGTGRVPNSAARVARLGDADEAPTFLGAKATERGEVSLGVGENQDGDSRERGRRYDRHEER